MQAGSSGDGQGQTSSGSETSTSHSARFSASGTASINGRFSVYGDFKGLTTADVRFQFEGVAGFINAESVSDGEAVVIIPSGAVSGTLKLHIRGSFVWAIYITINVNIQSGSGTPTAPPPPPPTKPVAPPPPPPTKPVTPPPTKPVTPPTKPVTPPPPQPIACNVTPTIAIVGTSVDILGNFPKTDRDKVEVSFAKVSKRVKPTRIEDGKLSVVVPQGAATGPVQVWWSGVDICHPILSITQKDGGLLDDAPEGEGLVGNIYKLPENTQNLPDFSKMTSIGSIVLPELYVPATRFEKGFPGLGEGHKSLLEWFGIRFRGKIVIPADGKYNFKINSDDGARLYIDDQEVVNNDGVHPPKENSKEVTLKKGSHTIRVDYFQGPRFYIALQMFWKQPGQNDWAIVPKSVLKRGLGPNP